MSNWLDKNWIWVKKKIPHRQQTQCWLASGYLFVLRCDSWNTHATTKQPYQLASCAAQGCRSRGFRGFMPPPQILADQLILSQPGGTDYAHHITTAHPDFQTFLRHCIGIVCRPACLPIWLLTAFCLQAPRTSFEAPRYCWMDKRSCSVKISNRKFGHPMHSAQYFIWLSNMYHKNVEPACCKKRQKRSKPRNWFGE